MGHVKKKNKREWWKLWYFWQAHLAWRKIHPSLGCTVEVLKQSQAHPLPWSSKSCMFALSGFLSVSVTVGSQDVSLPWPHGKEMGRVLCCCSVTLPWGKSRLDLDASLTALGPPQLKSSQHRQDDYTRTLPNTNMCVDRLKSMWPSPDYPTCGAQRSLPTMNGDVTLLINLYLHC